MVTAHFQTPRLRGARLLFIAALSLLTTGVFAQNAVTASAGWQTREGASVLTVHLGIPSGYHLYVDKLSVHAGDGVTLTPRAHPEPDVIRDPIEDVDVKAYGHDVNLDYDVAPGGQRDLDVTVKFQTCDDSTCYLPTQRKLHVAGGAPTGAATVAPDVTPAPGGPVAAEGVAELAARFRVGGAATGYVKAPEFIAFLDRAKRGESTGGGGIAEVFQSRGAWAACLVILLGGLLLNLTPCVLPMIPVNLAIIGAGSAAGSRGRGFVLGAAYGLGIALVYGILGLIVVLTGARFGTLNASAWFNFTIAAVFLVLALGMFDVILIDLSRFQSRVGGGGAGRGRLLTALFFGGVAALLAGACVAPIVISVVVLATDLYARGNRAGLLLPFLLGVGMALPWPLAGAGMSFLPKPGRWMEVIKKAFGVIILLAALYYGWLGISLVRSHSPESREAVAAAQAESGDAWETALAPGLARALAGGQPVLLDFWASWCKSCLHMEHTTFRDAEVRKAMAPFVKIKYRAEDADDPATKAVLDQYGVIGLPTYVVLLPEAAAR